MSPAIVDVLRVVGERAVRLLGRLPETVVPHFRSIEDWQTSWVERWEPVLPGS
jgi:hypothetical protein